MLYNTQQISLEKLSPIALTQAERDNNPTHRGAFNLLVKASSDGEQAISLSKLLQIDISASNSLVCSQGRQSNKSSLFTNFHIP